MDAFGGRAKANRRRAPWIIKERRPHTCLPVGTKPGSVGMWTENRKGGIDTGRTAAGRPVRSIRKNNVLPGSGPTDLHFGKNDLVPCNFRLAIVIWSCNFHLVISILPSSFNGHAAAQIDKVQQGKTTQALQLDSTWKVLDREKQAGYSSQANRRDARARHALC